MRLTVSQTLVIIQLEVLALAFTLLAVIALSGCGLFPSAPVDPGSSPAVVAAERSTRIAADTLHEFLTFEVQNRAVLKERFPAISAFADSLVEKDPDTGKGRAQAAIEAARTLTKAYKASRSAADKETLDEALVALEELARQAREYLAAARSDFAVQPAGPAAPTRGLEGHGNPATHPGHPGARVRPGAQDPRRPAAER